MAELKTKVNNTNVLSFIGSLGNETRKADSLTMLSIMRKITGKKPKMWGTNMIGFGEYHYKYESGHEGDWFVTGFSPRKQNLVIYIMPGFSGYTKLMNDLGKHKTGKSCLYINNIVNIKIKVLEKIIKQSIKDMQSMYACK